VRSEYVGAGGAQAELLRVPLADGTLVATPDTPSADLIPSLLAASDVLGTGWYGTVAAESGSGKTVAVVGDGAVGLLAVLVAKQLGAGQIIAMSRRPEFAQRRPAHHAGDQPQEHEHERRADH
jgi:threonine dehydrogenase-like Zn-dependent dehydrogenase